MRFSNCLALLALTLASAIGKAETTQKKEIAGIGLALKKTAGGFTISKVVSDSPAAHSPLIHEGDLVTAVKSASDKDWTAVQALTMEQTMSLVRGEVGTMVSLKVESKFNNGPREVSLKRLKLKLAVGEHASQIE